MTGALDKAFAVGVARATLLAVAADDPTGPLVHDRRDGSGLYRRGVDGRAAGSCLPGRCAHGRASSTRLKGVSATRLTRLKPPSPKHLGQALLAGLGAERQADLLAQRGGRAEHRRAAVENPPDWVEVLLDRVARQGLDDHPRAIGVELLAHVRRGAHRVAHVVQRIEHAHQVERPASEVLGRGNLEAHAV